MNPRITFIVVICLSFFSCRKDDTDFPPEAGCTKFIGKYKMYDSINSNYYTMTIACIPSFEQTVEDTFIFGNYANKFDFKTNISYGLNDPGVMSNVIINPLKDHYGNSWAFSSGGYQSTDDRLNRLVGDSIYIRFSYDNTPYYMSDGIPYESCNFCRQSGVKIP